MHGVADGQRVRDWLGQAQHAGTIPAVGAVQVRVDLAGAEGAGRGHTRLWSHRAAAAASAPMV